MYARAVAAISTALLGAAALLMPGSDARAGAHAHADSPVRAGGTGVRQLVIGHRGACAEAPR